MVTTFFAAVRGRRSCLDGVTELFNPECRIATPVCEHVFQLAVTDADVLPAEVEAAAASQVSLMRLAVIHFRGLADLEQYLRPRVQRKLPECGRFEQLPFQAPVRQVLSATKNLRRIYHHEHDMAGHEEVPTLPANPPNLPAITVGSPILPATP
jgi:hypothetical protein